MMGTETPPGRCAFILVVIASTVPILITGYFVVSNLLLLRRGDADPKCENPRLEWGLWFDVSLLLIFLVGSIGVLLKMKAVQITCMALLIVTTLSLMVINVSIDIGGTFAEDTKRIQDFYRLETYAPWTQKFLLMDSGWNTYKNCLIERKICDKLEKRDFVQGGCCMPPPYCGYEEKNQTWVVPKTGQYADDVNCVRWDSDKRKLCYDCETCQAVYISTFNDSWALRALGPILGSLILAACFYFTCEDDWPGNNRSGGRADNNRSGGRARNNRSGGRANNNRSGGRAINNRSGRRADNDLSV